MLTVLQPLDIGRFKSGGEACIDGLQNLGSGLLLEVPKVDRPF